MSSEPLTRKLKAMNPRIITALPDVSLFGGLILILLINRFVPLLVVGGLGVWFIGALLVLFSLVAGFSVLFSLRRRGTTTSAGEMPEKLVTGGAFRFSRNPYYLASASLLLGVALLAGSLLGLLVPALYVFTINRVVVPFEEQLLEQVFGGEFEEYRSSVNRWL